MKVRSFVKKKARVEVMPLIDTMFLLLVFFIYAMLTMVVHKGIDVNLPQGQTTVNDTKDYHVIVLSKDGELYVNEQRVVIEQLNGYLQKMLDKPQEARMYLRIDREVAHGRVMAVMDVLRLLGIEKIFFEMDAVQ